MRVQILVDNPSSWYVPYAKVLVEEVSKKAECTLIHRHELIVEGDILCILACEKKVMNLELNKNNIVVHESELPAGKGWSPLTWQILEGKNEIPITLFEAGEKIDSGVIYFQEYIKLSGSELLPEIKRQQGLITNKLVKRFIEKYPNITGKDQTGIATHYKRRTPEDSQIDITKSISEQFDLLRVVDNERYPAFFEYKGKKYILKIYDK